MVAPQQARGQLPLGHLPPVRGEGAEARGGLATTGSGHDA
jgi:hypothetical protein